MNVEFDWTVLEKVGVAGICLALIYFGFQAFRLILEQWKNSTDAVNKNTDAFVELSKVFERSYEREVAFQEHVKEKLDASEAREKSTLKKVAEIHSKIIN